MQETQYQTRLAQEDKRWMIGDVELGSVLAPFSASLATPLSLEAAPQPQSELSSAQRIATNQSPSPSASHQPTAPP